MKGKTGEGAFPPRTPPVKTLPGGEAVRRESVTAKVSPIQYGSLFRATPSKIKTRSDILPGRVSLFCLSGKLTLGIR